MNGIFSALGVLIKFAFIIVFGVFGLFFLMVLPSKQSKKHHH